MEGTYINADHHTMYTRLRELEDLNTAMVFEINGLKRYIERLQIKSRFYLRKESKTKNIRVEDTGVGDLEVLNDKLMKLAYLNEELAHVKQDREKIRKENEHLNFRLSTLLVSHTKQGEQQHTGM